MRDFQLMTAFVDAIDGAIQDTASKALDSRDTLIDPNALFGALCLVIQRYMADVHATDDVKRQMWREMESIMHDEGVRAGKMAIH